VGKEGTKKNNKNKESVTNRVMEDGTPAIQRTSLPKKMRVVVEDNKRRH
jgi:hypothetical protein